MREAVGQNQTPHCVSVLSLLITGMLLMSSLCGLRAQTVDRMQSMAGGTCYMVWRRSPWRRRVRWCGWRRWQPAGCWSRNANLRGWSSWVESLRKMSTASPTHAEIRRGRSYTRVPHAGKPPAHQNKTIVPMLFSLRHFHTKKLGRSRKWASLFSPQWTCLLIFRDHTCSELSNECVSDFKHCNYRSWRWCDISD